MEIEQVDPGQPDPAFDDVALYARLDALGIAYRTVEHPPVFTVDESKALRGELPGGHIKNLFLRDKKRHFWLLTALEHRKIDLRALREPLGARGGLSFASPDRLWQALGVRPGAVTPFGIVNDVEGRVRFVLDRGVLDCDPINAHPLRNDRTTALSVADLLHFAEACDHPPLYIDLEDT